MMNHGVEVHKEKSGRICLALGMYLSKGVCLDKFKEKLFYNNKMKKLNMCVGVIREGSVRKNRFNSAYAADALMRLLKILLKRLIPLSLTFLILKRLANKIVTYLYNRLLMSNLKRNY